MMRDRRSVGLTRDFQKVKWYLIPLFLGTALMSMNSATAGDWKNILSERLPIFGHRNWVVVVDAAYPAQTSAGIETILCEDSQIDVVSTVLGVLREAKHVRPTIYLDKELEAVSEKDAPGISEYRKQLSELLEGLKKTSLLHEKIIGKLDEAGKVFKILILKTKLTLPYTSVFIQLDCGYWSDEAEKRLRKSMSK
jgi:L-fucose mutarotase/ribose pyranase (RbsD/FucU family)